jgi:K+-sensing histidine kinase KdpD
MLDVSKLENGAMVLKKEPCLVNREIMLILADFRYLFRDRKIGVELPTEMISVQADKELFSRIIQNLLGNALKYTSEKGEISIKALRQNEHLYISITDNGPGIPEDCREKIFDKYAQVELKAENKLPSSSGLGLTFCKMAVEAHGGKIGTLPKPGGGSVFWFLLPMGE